MHYNAWVVELVDTRDLKSLGTYRGPCWFKSGLRHHLSGRVYSIVSGTDSGTFDYFVEEVFHDDKEPLLSTNNLQMSEDDNILIQGVMGSPYAIGFVGYAYYQANRDNLNILDIEGIEASKKSVDNASYPLARSLSIYTTASIMRDKPQIAAFINFLLSYVNEEIVSVGYFPVDQMTLLKGKEMWLEIMEF